MIISRNGVTYDTRKDAELVGEVIVLGEADNGKPRSLCITSSGQLYLRGSVTQFRDDGDWVADDAIDGCHRRGIDPLQSPPDPRRRSLETVTPITFAEAYRLSVKNLLPECFQEHAMRGAPEAT